MRRGLPITTAAALKSTKGWGGPIRSNSNAEARSLPQLFLPAPPKELITISEKQVADTSNHAKALRAIGDALEALDVDIFELTSEEKNYIVRVKSQRHKNRKIQRFLKKTGGRILHYFFPSRYPSVDIRLIYTPEDVERLHCEGQSRRRNAGTIPNRLPQALRAIGFYIDLKKARLVKLSRRGEVMTIRYETDLDGSKTEDFDRSSLYTLFMQMYVKRRDGRRAG
jgi:hypothetical protein